MLKDPTGKLLADLPGFLLFISLTFIKYLILLLWFPSANVRNENDSSAAKSKTHCTAWLLCRAIFFQKKERCTEWSKGKDIYLTTSHCSRTFIIAIHCRFSLVVLLPLQYLSNSCRNYFLGNCKHHQLPCCYFCKNSDKKRNNCMVCFACIFQGSTFTPTTIILLSSITFCE